LNIFTHLRQPFKLRFDVSVTDGYKVVTIRHEYMDHNSFFLTLASKGFISIQHDCDMMLQYNKERERERERERQTERQRK
jgi:hypothetical protein